MPLTAITLDGDNLTGTDTGVDTINLQDLPATIAAAVLGGAGNDIVNVGSTTNSLDPILGPITVSGETNDAAPTNTAAVTANGTTVTQTLESGDTLNVLDQGDTDANAYVLGDGTIMRAGSGTITFDTTETINVLAGNRPGN